MALVFLQCTGKWPCESPRLNKLCGDNGVTYDSRCHMRRDECIYDIDITVTKGACTGELKCMNIMHIAMYVCMYVCMHFYVMYMDVFVCNVCMYVYMYICMHMYACIYVCMYVCVCTCIYECVIN